MQKSTTNRYIITISFGKRKIHGKNMYNADLAQERMLELIDIGVNKKDIKIDTYESIFC